MKISYTYQSRKKKSEKGIIQSRKYDTLNLFVVSFMLLSVQEHPNTTYLLHKIYVKFAFTNQSPLPLTNCSLRSINCFNRSLTEVSL